MLNIGKTNILLLILFNENTAEQQNYLFKFIEKKSLIKERVHFRLL